MQLQEFTFILQDLKVQLKQIPSLPLLLKSIQKTTKKLECLNLYSLVDRREFDFQLFQNETFEEIRVLLQDVTNLKRKAGEGSINMEGLLDLQHRMDTIKQQKIQAFDKLNKLEQVLTIQIENLVETMLLDNGPKLENEIKEVEQDQEDVPEEHTNIIGNQQNRIESLKKQIDDLNTKIMKINRGKGKWFDGDHNDFIKLYNRLGGDPQKIVDQGVKILGMKSIEIMDHLQVYENYLQLQKQKKLAAQQFKSIKSFEKETKYQQDVQNKMLKQQKEKMRQRMKEEQNITKKMQVEQYKRKKAEQHEKLIKQIEKQQSNQKKVKRVSVEKSKDIEQRNKRLILQKQQEYKNRIGLLPGPSTAKNKPKIPVPPPTTQIAALKVNKISKAPSQLSSQLKKQ